MRVFHEIARDRLDSVLKNGIIQGSRGDKDADELASKTNQFLDELCPESLRVAGISRVDNIYGYIAQHGMVFSLLDGQEVPVSAFVKQINDALLEIKVEIDKCFVSDLDVYDTLKSAVEGGADKGTIRQLASVYWTKITPLKDFDGEKVRRAEVMITHDILPKSIRVLKT